MNNYQHLGHKIKERRFELGMTQAHFAFRCRMEQATISRIEAGKANPTLHTLGILERYLQTSLSELFQKDN